MSAPTLINTPPIAQRREGTSLWLFKIVAGLLIVFLLGVHFVVNHLVAPGGLLTYADVVRYYANPAVRIMEITFLVFVVSHALVGLRGILLDLNPSARILRIIDIALTVVGIVAIVYGIALVWAIAG